MSKFITSAYFLFFLFSTSQVYSQTTSIPDVNFEQALIDNGMDSDGVINGMILTADVQSRTILNVRDKNISDLTGIESFTSLTSLNVGENNLMTLDLSSNTNLMNLFCYTNNLIELDLSNNLDLKVVNCSENLLESIDISLNTQLEGFYCALNQLDNLDVSTNNLLDKFWCYDNNLTTLNIKNNANGLLSGTFGNAIIYSKFRAGTNPNLTCIFVDNAIDANNFDGDYMDWEVDNATTFVEEEAECNLLSNDNFELSLFSAYPNPFIDDLTITSTNKILKLELYDSHGRLVAQDNAINFSDLSSGIYLLKLYDEYYNTKIQKIIKK